MKSAHKNSKALYLIRFDDITPQMNWAVWEEIEAICDRHQIKPLLAVVPENQDQKLNIMPERNDFWDRVRAWKKKGYEIGIHGYQHRYETKDSGLVGLNARSEFAGLSYEIQLVKLQKSMTRFKAEDVTSRIFVAPGHSFDCETLKALQELHIPYLSDGFFPFPYRLKNEILWIPQQLWKFKNRPFGIWTVCYHFNKWTSADLADFEKNIIDFKDSISSFEEIIKIWNLKESAITRLLLNKIYEKYFNTKRYAILLALQIRRVILQKT